MTSYSQIHRRLQIPKNYYISPSHEGSPSIGTPKLSKHNLEPKAPPITEFERNAAIQDLQAAGELDGGKPEDILRALCAKLARLK